MKNFVIITPTYKRDELLKQAIQSVISQNYDSYLHLIVDDNNCEETQKVVNSFKNHNLKYLGRIRNRNDKKTCSNAINFGINYLLSHGFKFKFIKILHDDDFLYKGTMKRHEQIFCVSPKAGIIYGQEIRLDEQQGTYEVKGSFISKNPKMVKIRVLAQYVQYTTLTFLWEEFIRLYQGDFKGWYDPDISYGEDKDITARYLQLLHTNKMTCEYDATISSVYRKSGSDRISSNIQIKDRKEQIKTVISRNCNLIEKILIYTYKFILRPTHLIPIEFRNRNKFLVILEEFLYHNRKPLKSEYIFWYDEKLRKKKIKLLTRIRNFDYY